MLRYTFLLYILLLYACSKDKFKADIPSYLRIEQIDLETESYQGTNSEKITDVWVTMDGTFLGAFELPSTIPILADGEHNFSIYAGVKANGISATRIRYPFYQMCDLHLKLVDAYQQLDGNIIQLHRDSTIVVKASTKYSNQTEFLFIEDFEDAGSVMEASEISDTTIIKSSLDSLVFEGYGSGEIHLDSIHDFFEIINAEFISLSSLYNTSMLELNYKCNHSFKIGVAVKNPGSDVVNKFESLQINPSEEWNKIYVHTTNQVNLGNSSDLFGVFMGSVKSESTESAWFYFDNIKWIQAQ